MDTQVSRGGAARDHRRVAIGQPGKNPAGPRMFEELAHDEGGPSLNVELLGTYNLPRVSAVMHFALNCIPGQAHLRLAALDAIGAIVVAVEGPWLGGIFPTPRSPLVENLYDRLSLHCVGKRQMVTNNRDSLRVLLADFFNLPAEMSPWQITQETIEPWDSPVMVQRLLPQPTA